MKNKIRVLALILVGIMLFGTLCIFAGCGDREHYYNVSFQTDGGTSVSPITVKENEKIGTLPTTEKDGYRFLEWSDTQGGTVNIDERYVVTKDVTLFAVFRRNPASSPNRKRSVP